MDPVNVLARASQVLLVVLMVMVALNVIAPIILLVALVLALALIGAEAAYAACHEQMPPRRQVLLVLVLALAILLAFGIKPV